jgi:hypothetical protein
MDLFWRLLGLDAAAKLTGRTLPGHVRSGTATTKPATTSAVLLLQGRPPARVGSSESTSATSRSSSAKHIGRAINSARGSTLCCLGAPRAVPTTQIPRLYVHSFALIKKVRLAPDPSVRSQRHVGLFSKSANDGTNPRTSRQSFLRFRSLPMSDIEGKAPGRNGFSKKFCGCAGVRTRCLLLFALALFPFDNRQGAKPPRQKLCLHDLPYL